MAKEKFVIIDGNALLHRAWHAIPNLTTKKGLMVNAVYGWFMIFFKMYKELRPNYIAVAFDVKGKIFRHKIYPKYKANRQKKEQELYDQLLIVKDILKLFNIKIFEKKGFEADDIIGFITNQTKQTNLKTYIVTGDLDLLQLVSQNILVYKLRKGLSDVEIYNIKEIEEKFEGLKPNQIIDFKALKGDPSDNIPGVPGIGEKTAIKLIKEFNSIENLYKKLEDKPENLINKNISKRIINLLLNNKDLAFLSKKLIQINTKLNIDFNLEDCKFEKFNKQKIIKKFQELEFKSLLSKIPNLNNINILQKNLFISKNYTLINTQEKFEEFIKILEKMDKFAFDTETDSLNKNAKLLGISFCGKPGEAFYLLNKEKWLKKLKPIFENKKIKKIAHNAKFDIQVLQTCGINVENLYFDTMIASYLLNPGTRNHKLDTIVFSIFGYEMTPIEKLIGKKNKKQKSLDEINLESVAQYSCEDADWTFRLVEKLEKKLKQEKLFKLFKQIEMPLIPILLKMENNGFKIDIKYLQKLNRKITKKLNIIDQKIYKLAGEEFNINSPIQLKKILFEKLKLPTKGIKKSKTGISTAAGELEKMKNIHPIIDLILQHRELSKLKSTYIENLPKLADENNRVHTTFNQTITATGRLSSTNPNLQNIPIRSEFGKEIRKSFIAEKGYKILSADYSQVELRVIASLSNDEKLIQSFKKGEDIHKRTAAEIFHIDINKVTPEQRYAAKAINFGIIYGLGPIGLAKSVGISTEEAKIFIDRYFQIYKGVKKYIEKILKKTREQGYVESLFGRKRYLYEINSNVQIIRASAERMAINAPIQGSASDIIKLAMIKIDNYLSTNYPQAKMLLQIHDELVFEVPVENLLIIAKKIKFYMENVCKLKVPILVHLGYGDNWEDLKKLEL